MERLQFPQASPEGSHTAFVKVWEIDGNQRVSLVDISNFYTPR